MSYSRMAGGSDYDAFFEGVLRDVTLVGISISQQVVGRHMRVLGALAGGDKKSKEQKLLVCLTVHRTCELIRASYFMLLLIQANLLMERFHTNSQFAKLDKLKGQLVFFYSTYEILTTIAESALILFDAYYDQWNTLVAMGLRPPDKDEDGRMTWMSADATALGKAKKQQYAARDRAERAGIYDRPAAMPTFRAAFEEARQIAQKMAEVDKQLTLQAKSPDLDELSSRIDELAERVMNESRAAESAEETGPREIMKPSEEESNDED